MIDIENAIINMVHNTLIAYYPNITVYSDNYKLPETFPTVNITECDNYITKDLYDSSGIEKFTNVMYQVDVYSNDLSGRKAQAKHILQLVDSTLNDCGFLRTSVMDVPTNTENLYRITARYKATVEFDKTIYRG